MSNWSPSHQTKWPARPMTTHWSYPTPRCSLSKGPPWSTRFTTSTTLPETNSLHVKISHPKRKPLFLFSDAIVDGRNPAPPEMYKTLYIMGYLPYQLVQDFFSSVVCSFQGRYPFSFQLVKQNIPWSHDSMNPWQSTSSTRKNCPRHKTLCGYSHGGKVIDKFV